MAKKIKGSRTLIIL